MPRSARLLIIGIAAVAVALTVSLVAVSGAPRPLPVLLLAAVIAGGDAFRVDLAFRRGGNATFGLSDAGLVAGLLLLPSGEVVLGAVGGMAVLHLIERVGPVKAMFNTAEFVVGAAAAAAVVHLVAPRPGDLGIRTVLGVAVGMALALLVNTLSVSAMIAFTSEFGWWRTFRRVVPTAALMAVGNTCIGLLAVLLLESYPWALLALGVPLLLLYRASQGEVRAEMDGERSAAYVSVEHRLGECRDPEEVARVLQEGTTQVLGCNAALWRDGRWIGPVPSDSGPCPVEPSLGVPLIARGPGLGPAVDRLCAAIGVGGGVLVVWEGEMSVSRETEDWLERLARSGRVHFERAAAASALRQEQATLRAVVDGTADGISLYDAVGLVHVWNPAMAALAGRSAETVVGRRIHDVLGDGPWDEDGVHDVARHPDRVWRVSVATLRDHAQGTLRVAVIHDVSAERRVARMKDDMLAVVSHELRTPLTPIKASAQLLLQRWHRMLEPQRDDLLTLIDKRADHLTRLVNDLLLVAQLSPGSDSRPTLNPVVTDLAAVVRNSVLDMGVTHSDHEFATDVPDQLIATADPLRLRQVVDNLVDNACKYSPPGSVVYVRLQRSADKLLVEVEDRGRGIPPAEFERVFERFERIDDPMLMTTSGAGLGLFIVRELVSAMGGRVWLESPPGKGTVARITLPIEPETEHAETSTQEVTDTTTTGPSTLPSW